MTSNADDQGFFDTLDPEDDALSTLDSEDFTSFTDKLSYYRNLSYSVLITQNPQTDVDILAYIIEMLARTTQESGNTGKAQEINTANNRAISYDA